LVGDIGVLSSVGKAKYQQFLLAQAEKFKKVFVILGNHEFYGAIVHEVFEEVQRICSLHPNLIFMHKCSLKINGLRILGTTLWSLVPDDKVQRVGRSLNDYHLISIIDENTKKLRKIQVEDTNRWFKDELEWLKKEIDLAKQNKEDVLIMTHHSPIADGSHPQFFGSDINGAFCTDLDYLMGDPIKVWIYGHTHYNQRVTRNGTKIISNSKGYPHENPKEIGVPFDPNFVLTI